MAQKKAKTDGDDLISNKKAKTDGDDLISKLPDEILGHILSFIPTKAAVPTNLLSKRWKLVWKDVPSLDFGLDLFPGAERFIHRFLILHKAKSLRKVRLQILGQHALHANQWFEALVARNPENLDLYFYAHVSMLSPAMNLLPDSFYNQKNLAELKLRNLVLKVPPLVRFPRLETMKLAFVRFSAGNMKNLLSGCPSLTELHMDINECLNISTLHICSPTLQKLCLCIHDERFDSKVVIDTPKLRCLDLKGENPDTTITVSCSSVKAYVSNGQCGASSFTRLLRVFASESLRNLPVLNNLIHLTLEVDCDESNLALLQHILDYTPNVVYIIVKLRNPFDARQPNPLDLLHSVVSCIERVEINKESGQITSVVSCTRENAATTLKKFSVHGIPLHFALENYLLKGCDENACGRIVIDSILFK